jgi:hypothetical protein
MYLKRKLEYAAAGERGHSFGCEAIPTSLIKTVRIVCVELGERGRA